MKTKTNIKAGPTAVEISIGSGTSGAGAGKVYAIGSATTGAGAGK